MSTPDNLRISDGRGFKMTVVCRFITLFILLLGIFMYNYHSEKLEGLDKRISKIENSSLSNDHSTINTNKGIDDVSE